MNHITDKLRTVFTVLICAICLAGCSSHTYEDPDITFKGEINDELLSDLADGKLISEIRCYSAEIYSKPIDDRGNIADEWQFVETERWSMGYNDHKMIRFNLLEMYIKDGRAWIYDPYYRAINYNIPLLYGMWGSFARIAKIEDLYGYKCDFVYDKQNHKLTINGNRFDVECCDENHLVLSYEEITETGDYGEKIPLQKFKYVFDCSPLHGSLYDPVHMSNKLADITMFNSEAELKIHMIQSMRKFFGDEFDPEEYPNFGIKSKIDLARYEENLRNGLPDELYRDYSNYWNRN